MSTPDTEGLRKAARRVFWEAKQIDEKAAKQTEDASIYIEAYCGQVGNAVTSNVSEFVKASKPSSFLDGVMLGMQMSNLAHGLLGVYWTKEAREHWHNILSVGLAHSDGGPGAEKFAAWKLSTLIPPQLVEEADRLFPEMAPTPPAQGNEK